MAETREEARKRKLAQKPTKSAFKADDEAQARQRARDPQRKTPKKEVATKRRDFRGTEGQISDADNEGRRANQSTDSNN